MKTLFINHDRTVSGSSLSLIEILKVLSNSDKHSIVLSHKNLKKFYQKYNLKNVTYIYSNHIPKFNLLSHNSFIGIRFIMIFYELFSLPFFIFFLFKNRDQIKGVKYIHVNESVLILTGMLTKFFFKAILIVHVRSKISNNFIEKKLFHFFSYFVDNFIVIDEIVKKTLPLKSTIPCKIIHNTHSLSETIRKKKENDFDLIIGYIGAITRVKGVDLIIDAINQIKLDNKYNVKLIIAGKDIIKTNFILEKIYKLFSISSNLSENYINKIKKLDLQNNIHFIGYLESVELFYNRIDINIFTSHLLSYNRSVFEAAFYGIPSIIRLNKRSLGGLINNKNCYILNEANSFQLKDIMIDAIKTKNYFFIGKNAKKFFNAKHNKLKFEKLILELFN